MAEGMINRKQLPDPGVEWYRAIISSMIGRMFNGDESFARHDAK